MRFIAILAVISFHFAIQRNFTEKNIVKIIYFGKLFPGCFKLKLRWFDASWSVIGVLAIIHMALYGLKELSHFPSELFTYTQPFHDNSINNFNVSLELQT